jgi:hypothetical protein
MSEDPHAKCGDTFGWCSLCRPGGREECDCDFWHSKHRWHCATTIQLGAKV